MKTLNVCVECIPKKIPIGHVGENVVEAIQFDYSEWKTTYGEGTLSLVLQRSPDTIPYAVDMTDGLYVVTSTDLEYQGAVRAQLVYNVTGNPVPVKKSDVFLLGVDVSLGDAGDIPDPWQSWLDRVLQASDQAQEAVEHYPKVENGYWYVWNVSTESWTNTGQKAQGEEGAPGVGVASTVLNADYTLTITLTDGTSYTTPSIRGATGNGIASTVLNANYTLTITFTDGTSYTTPSIRGAQGVPGQDYVITSADYDEIAGRVDTMIAGERQAALDDIDEAKTNAVSDVTAEGTTQKGLVTSEGTTQKGLVTSEGTTQVGLVTAKGQEVIGSIPADYSELSADVSELKADLTLTNSFVYEEVETTLPQEVKGMYKLGFPNEGDEIISGTHNVAQLLGIKEGTFTVNGVIFTVSGTTVTISGQPTADFNYSFADGDKKTSTELSGMVLPLHEMLYTASQKVTSGTVYPAVMSRGKVSGNAFVTQNNTAQFTMDKTTCGGLYAYMQASKTYSCTFIIALFPYATNNSDPYREETSDITVYTENGVYALDGYTWKVGTATIKELRSKFPKTPKLVYSTRTIPYSSMVECLDVYIPAKEGYVDYIFGRTASELTPAEGGGNVWRLVQIDAVTDGLTYRFHITQLGETEMAIKIVGTDDFIGGTTHGDEVMDADSLLFVIDGQPVDITTFTDVTEFETLQCFLTSNMYHPSDHTTLVGVHGREWLFNADGLYIGQTVEYKADLTLTNSYMPMVCALRGNDTASTLQVTDTYSDDGNYMIYDVSEGGFTTYPNQLKQDVREINLFGHDSGVRVTLKILEQPESLRGEGVFLYNGVNTYNKIYCCLCGYGGGVGLQQTVTNGDKWKVKSQIIVEVG